MEIYVGTMRHEAASALFIFNFYVERREKNFFCLPSHEVQQFYARLNPIAADLCCAKMLLIAREPINFTVNEVINSKTETIRGTRKCEKVFMQIILRLDGFERSLASGLCPCL